MVCNLTKKQAEKAFNLISKYFLHCIFKVKENLTQQSIHAGINIRVGSILKQIDIWLGVTECCI